MIDLRAHFQAFAHGRDVAAVRDELARLSAAPGLLGAVTDAQGGPRFELVQAASIEAVFDHDSGQGFLVSGGSVGPLQPNADVTMQLVQRLGGSAVSAP